MKFEYKIYVVTDNFGNKEAAVVNCWCEIHKLEYYCRDMTAEV
jgi:hypothetical protein